MLAELDHFSFSPFPPPLGHIGWVRTKRAEKLKSYGTVVNVGTSFFLWFGDFCVDFSPLPLRSSVMAVPILPLAILEILVGNLLVPATIFQFSFWEMKEVFNILILGQRPTCFAIWDALWHLL
jgi:hypothetical protein